MQGSNTLPSTIWICSAYILETIIQQSRPIKVYSVIIVFSSSKVGA
nr:MAG TPA: hypothetical protein [Caudoviricetes sp.]